MGGFYFVWIIKNKKYSFKRKPPIYLTQSELKGNCERSKNSVSCYMNLKIHFIMILFRFSYIHCQSEHARIFPQFFGNFTGFMTEIADVIRLWNYVILLIVDSMAWYLVNFNEIHIPLHYGLFSWWDYAFR